MSRDCDCFMWRAPERIRELTLSLVSAGFIAESDAEQCYEHMLRFAVANGFLPYTTYRREWNPSLVSRQGQRTTLDAYLAYVAEGPCNGDLAAKAAALGVSHADIANWARRYLPPHTLSQVKRRHLPSTAITLLLRAHPWQSNNQLAGATGWDIRRVTGITKEMARRGLLVRRRGVLYVEFACATKRNVRTAAVTAHLENQAATPAPRKLGRRRDAGRLPGSSRTIRLTKASVRAATKARSDAMP